MEEADRVREHVAETLRTAAVEVVLLWRTEYELRQLGRALDLARSLDMLRGSSVPLDQVVAFSERASALTASVQVANEIAGKLVAHIQAFSPDGESQ